MRMAFSHRLAVMEGGIGLLKSRIRGGLALKIGAMESAVDVLGARIAAADPRALLSRGYVLAADSRGVVIKAAKGRKAGDRVTVMFSDGVLGCRVEDVSEFGGDDYGKE